MRKILITISLLLASCASMSGDWTPWKTQDVSYEKRVWRFCSANYDGSTLHHKGFCYISQECRTRSVFIGKDKNECRNVPLFCGWGDTDCMERYNIFNNIIVNKEKIR